MTAPGPFVYPGIGDERPWLTLQCVRCSNPYKSRTLSARLCPPCKANGAIDDAVGEVSGS